MVNHNDVVQLIVKQLGEVPSTPSSNLIEDISAATPLFGKNGLLDSVGLVTLIVNVEQAIEDKFGKSISLADERAMSQQHSPFRTIASLAEYATQLITRTLGVLLSSHSLVESLELLEMV